MKTQLIFASFNQGKILELQQFLEPFHYEILPQALLGIDDIEETGKTFVENALLKARHAAEQSGKSAIADDSGLVVDALDGAPGIYSARYAGKKCSSQENINKLLIEMEGFKEDQRRAHFHCTLVYLEHADDPAPIICEGRWEGFILEKPTGRDGFGYDPVFFDPLEHCSAAEMSLDQKNRVSHRGQALNLLMIQLRDKKCMHSS